MRPPSPRANRAPPRLSRAFRVAARARADNQITDAGARSLADGIRANKTNGGKLKSVDFECNRMTAAGETAMAEAMHFAGLETNEYTPAAVVDQLAALRAKDGQESIDVAQTMKQVIEDTGKDKYKKEASALRDRLCARASLGRARARVAARAV